MAQQVKVFATRPNDTGLILVTLLVKREKLLPRVLCPSYVLWHTCAYSQTNTDTPVQMHFKKKKNPPRCGSECLESKNSDDDVGRKPQLRGHPRATQKINKIQKINKPKGG